VRVIIQRVSEASVTIDGEVTSRIGKGLMILLGISEDDTEMDAQYLCEKCVGLRIFSDQDDKMNLSLRDVGGELLIISNFTLYADCRKGRRPSFVSAASPDKAIPLYNYFLEYARKLCPDTKIGTGRFGADMKVALVNDGPVTIEMDSKIMLETARRDKK